MKTSFLNVSFDSLGTISLPSHSVEVEYTTVLVNKLIQDAPKTFFLKINHRHINTLLDFTNCSSYELWYFDAKKIFTGKSFSIQNGDASFQILTQARFIALVPLGTKYAKIQSTSVQNEEGNFTLSQTLPSGSQPYAIEKSEWCLLLFDLTNEELIETLNKEIEKKGWVQARSHYLKCLEREIKNRPFNSDILFEYNNFGNVISFKLNEKVKLINETLEFITIN